MRAQVAAVSVVLVGAIALALGMRSSDPPEDIAGDEMPADSDESVASATLASTGVKPTRGPRRVTVRLLGDGPFVAPTTVVGIAGLRGDEIEKPRGTFRRSDEPGTTVFVCENPRFPPAAAVAALVMPLGRASLRVPLDVPRTASGTFAESFDVVATVRLADVTMVTGRVRRSSWRAVSNLHVELRGPRPPPAPAPLRPDDGGLRPPPPTLPGSSQDDDADDGALDRPLLAAGVTDDQGRYALPVSVATGETIVARVVATFPRTREGWERHLSAPTVVRGGERTSAPDLVVEEGAVVEGRVLAGPKEPAWSAVHGLMLAEDVPGNSDSMVWSDGWGDTGRLLGATIEDDNKFRLTGATVGPCLLFLRPPRGSRYALIAIHPDVDRAARAVVTAPATGVTLGTPSRELALRVEDADGGIDRAVIRIDGRVGSLELTTQVDGYADAIVPEGEPLKVVAEAEGHAPLSMTVSPATATDPVRLRLPLDSSVTTIARAPHPEDRRRPTVRAGTAQPQGSVLFVGCRVRDASGTIVPSRFVRWSQGGVGTWRDVVPGSGLMLEPSTPGRYAVEVVDERFEADPVEVTVRAEPSGDPRDWWSTLTCRLKRP